MPEAGQATYAVRQRERQKDYLTEKWLLSAVRKALRFLIFLPITFFVYNSLAEVVDGHSLI
jgi:hypothetical protein